MWVKAKLHEFVQQLHGNNGVAACPVRGSHDGPMEIGGAWVFDGDWGFEPNAVTIDSKDCLVSLATAKDLSSSSNCILGWHLTTYSPHHRNHNPEELTRSILSSTEHPIALKVVYKKQVSSNTEDDTLRHHFILFLCESSALGQNSPARWRAMLWMQRIQSAIRKQESKDITAAARLRMGTTQYDHSAQSHIVRLFNNLDEWSQTIGVQPTCSAAPLPNLDVNIPESSVDANTTVSKKENLDTISVPKDPKCVLDQHSISSLVLEDRTSHPCDDIEELSTYRSYQGSSYESMLTHRSLSLDGLAQRSRHSTVPEIAICPRARLSEAWEVANNLKRMYSNDPSPVSKVDLIAMNRPVCHTVCKGLHISSSIFAADMIAGYGHGITSYLRMGIDYPFPSESFKTAGKRFSEIPIADQRSESATLRSLLPYVLSYVIDEIERGENVLVFCNEGVSRSSTVVCTYLMVKSGMSWHDSVRYLSKIRPCVSPNIGFMHELQRFSRIIGRLPALFELNHLPQISSVVLKQMDHDEQLDTYMTYVLITMQPGIYLINKSTKEPNQIAKLKKLMSIALDDLHWVTSKLQPQSRPSEARHTLLTIKETMIRNGEETWPLQVLDERNLQEVMGIVTEISWIVPSPDGPTPEVSVTEFSGIRERKKDGRFLLQGNPEDCQGD